MWSNDILLSLLLRKSLKNKEIVKFCNYLKELFKKLCFVIIFMLSITSKRFENVIEIAVCNILLNKSSRSSYNIFILSKVNVAFI